VLLQTQQKKKRGQAKKRGKAKRVMMAGLQCCMVT
jgi:hypothetical protein